MAQSASVSCSCNLHLDCSAAGSFSKVVFRLFADPAFRKTGGGPSIDLACAPTATGCTGVFNTMPPKWNGRVSAVAVLYDMASYKLPKPK